MKSVEIVRTWMKSLPTPKVYENRTGGFVTGLDLSNEVLTKKLEDRAERFGIKKDESSVTQADIDDLYKSLNIDPGDKIACKMRGIRLDTIHMRGVEKMNTDDIFKYFQDFGPASIEWINDVSCNVKWLDEATAARALIGMSQAIVEQNEKKTPELLYGSWRKTYSSSDSERKLCSTDSDKQVPSIDSVLDERTGVSDSEDSDAEDGRQATGKSLSGPEVESLPSQDRSDKIFRTPSSATSSSSPSVDLAMPPGYWRIGKLALKAKALILRFATKDDKKLPGAEKRSDYYKTYGNPNYGGLKGLISGSKKRKMQAARNRTVVESMNQEEFASGADPSDGSSLQSQPRSKAPRMRMYADELEAKMKTKLTRQKYERENNVKNRLGKKYHKDDLRQLGRRFSVDSELEREEEDEAQNVQMNCVIPSRFNIWNDIAQTMADSDKPQSSNFVFDSNTMQADSMLSRETSRLSSLKPLPKPKYKTRLSDMKKKDEKRRYVSPLLRDDEDVEESRDLRTKIKKMKLDSHAGKHRSPLCKDD